MDDLDKLFHLHDLAHVELSLSHSDSTLCEHTSTYTDGPSGTISCMDCRLVLDCVLEDVFSNMLPLKNVKPVSLYCHKHHFNKHLSQWLCLTHCVPDTVITEVKQEVPPNTTPTKTILHSIL